MAKHPGGRPRKFQSPEEMQAVLDAYFSECEAQSRPLTVTGLAMALGLTKPGMRNYLKRSGYSDVLLRARLRVEAYCEERLFDKDGYSGARFVLMTCFRWRTSAEQEEHPAKTVAVIIR